MIAEREHSTLLSDIDKFKQYIAHLELKKQKLKDQVKVIEEDLGVKGKVLNVPYHLHLFRVKIERLFYV